MHPANPSHASSERSYRSVSGAEKVSPTRADEVHCEESEPPSRDTPSSIGELRSCRWLKLAGLQLQIMPINYSSVVVPPTSRSGNHAREWCTRVPMVPRP